MASNCGLISPFSLSYGYLGASSSDPTQDLDGSALEAGDLYYNSNDQKLKFYNGSAWEAIEAGASAGFAIAMAVAL